MAKAAAKNIKRTLDARRDTLDFRDRMYAPALIEVPTHMPLSKYKLAKVPVLNQGSEGACTGFGLATVANYLLIKRKVVSERTAVSPRMLYDLARRYDEWPGENYAGSSARGAMKAWHKHGVCSEDVWPYAASSADKHGLTEARTADARRRPLGAYFRVNHTDLVALHGALAEVGVLYATATVHDGWEQVGRDGVIPYSDQVLGGHAFAIVAYNATGFWIQNSWGTGWGQAGFACISYDDWLANGTDVWVARLGAPVILRKSESAASAHAATAGQSAAYSFSDLRPHLVSLGNDGKLKPGGDYGTTAEEVRQVFEDDIPRAMAKWKTKRILLYAHGGLVAEESAVQRLADYRAAFLDAEIYPLSFIWHSDAWTTITNILQDALRRRRPEGALDAAKDFLLERLDDALEPLARALTGKAAWDEMKENALAASDRGSGARLALNHLAKLHHGRGQVEVHVAGHSAGSIFHAPVVRLLTAKGPITSGYLAGEHGYGVKVSSCALWAPGCTIDLFKKAYLPAIEARTLERFALFVLSEKAEQDDNCAGLYRKSLLYLVSNALEAQPRIPGFLSNVPLRDGVPLLGLEKFINADRQLRELFGNGRARLIVAPNNEPLGSVLSSKAQHHGDFDDDRHTVRATLAHILDSGTGQAPRLAAQASRARPRVAKPAAAGEPAALELEFHRSSSSLSGRRMQIDRATRGEPRS